MWMCFKNVGTSYRVFEKREPRDTLLRSREHIPPDSKKKVAAHRYVSRVATDIGCAWCFLASLLAEGFTSQGTKKI